MEELDGPLCRIMWGTRHPFIAPVLPSRVPGLPVVILFRLVPGIQCSVIPLNKRVCPTKLYPPWLKQLGPRGTSLSRDSGADLSGSKAEIPGKAEITRVHLDDGCRATLFPPQKKRTGNMQQAKLLTGSDKHMYIYIYLFIYLFIYLCIYVFIYFFFYLSIYLFINLFIIPGEITWVGRVPNL